MKFPHASLALLLLVQNSCHSFIIPRQQNHNRLDINTVGITASTTSSFASTLDQNDSLSDIAPNGTTNSHNNDYKDKKGEEKAVVTAVSSNHVVVWDDESNEIVIKERNVEDNVKQTNVDGEMISFKRIIYEEVQEREVNGEENHNNMISLPSSNISSPLPSTTTNTNGIKMTKSNDPILSIPQENKVTSTTERKSITNNFDENKGTASISERITNSGVASAAAMATAAVNAAVSMKTLEAPSTAKSYIALDGSQTVIDEDGLPLRYDKDAIEKYWKKERGALNQRWGYFVSKTVPFLTRLTTLFIKDGKIDDKYIPELSEQARIDLQDLGPTFIKAGQMMSVRPDVLPQVSQSYQFSNKQNLFRLILTQIVGHIG